MLYTTSYLESFRELYAKTRNALTPDFGQGFDLIATVITVWNIGCRLAAGIELKSVSDLDHEYARMILPSKLTRESSISLAPQAARKHRQGVSGVIRGSVEGW